MYSTTYYPTPRPRDSHGLTMKLLCSRMRTIHSTLRRKPVVVVIRRPRDRFLPICACTPFMSRIPPCPNTITATPLTPTISVTQLCELKLVYTPVISVLLLWGVFATGVVAQLDTAIGRLMNMLGKRKMLVVILFIK